MANGNSSNINPLLGSLAVKIEVPGIDKVNGDLKKVNKTMALLGSNATRASKRMLEGMGKAGKSVESLSDVTKRHGAEQRKLSFVMLEASRGAEDFAIGFGINGIQGAIRGATNNMAQMGAIISPLVGTIVGFAGAGVAAIAVMFGMAKRSREAAKGVEELNTALKRLNDLRLRNLQFGFLREDIQAGDVKGAQRAQLAAERKTKEGRGKLQGTQRIHAARIQECGEKELFKGLALTQGEREDVIDAILRQQGINTGKRGEDFRGLGFAGLKKLKSQRETVLQDLSIRNASANRPLNNF